MSGIPQKLYHYTSKSHASQIETDGKIRGTPGESKHARFGAGVYLSDVPPSATDKEIVSANWGGQANPEKVGDLYRTLGCKVKVLTTCVMLHGLQWKVCITILLWLCGMCLKCWLHH